MFSLLPFSNQAACMRKPDTIEHLYLDFDGFFASVEQMRDPALRGRPVGIVPYEGGRTCIIACSREAKARGVSNVMMVDEAKRICRDLILVPQKPDLYRRAHNALIAEINSVIPVDVVKSIDELACRLDSNHRADPSGLAIRIKRAIRYNIGAAITCSIGLCRQSSSRQDRLRHPETRWHDDMVARHHAGAIVPYPAGRHSRCRQQDEAQADGLPDRFDTRPL
jgi:DNA polymerase-4